MGFSSQPHPHSTLLDGKKEHLCQQLAFQRGWYPAGDATELCGLAMASWESVLVGNQGSGFPGNFPLIFLQPHTDSLSFEALGCEHRKEQKGVFWNGLRCGWAQLWGRLRCGRAQDRVGSGVGWAWV